MVRNADAFLFYTKYNFTLFKFCLSIIVSNGIQTARRIHYQQLTILLEKTKTKQNKTNKQINVPTCNTNRTFKPRSLFQRNVSF